ncbi:hypothetical protein PGT21_024956 [Puccinia graminis f. sp. tritici]|uniref:Uncharacterized protein n=1 Tax=Puccinia graminis f. sp. tritici TaxID=56615 RepID=A0A5B0PLA5_PUCGR|nr:hypothetical protein PGT21_024956 [Puccinia graminis f. sp. tritici]
MSEYTPLINVGNTAFTQHREPSVASSGSSLIHPLDTRLDMPQPSPITPDNHLRSHHSVAESNTHFLEKEPEIPKYAGPTDSRRVVKIKPLDKELFFDGTNMPIEKFIKRYERAGEADGASATDLAKQIISFVRGGDLKDEVEEMEGYETVEWEELKKQLLDRFGKSLPLVKYTKQDLKDLVNTAGVDKRTPTPMAHANLHASCRLVGVPACTPNMGPS